MPATKRLTLTKADHVTYALPQACGVYRTVRTPLQHIALEGEQRRCRHHRREFRRRGRSRRPGEPAKGILGSKPQDRYGVEGSMHYSLRISSVPTRNARSHETFGTTFVRAVSQLSLSSPAYRHVETQLTRSIVASLGYAAMAGLRTTTSSRCSGTAICRRSLFQDALEPTN